MRKMKLPYKDAAQMYARIVFNVIACNYDDHTKNISFLLRQNQQWRLSPAYDVIYSYNPQGIWTKRHQMSVNRKRENIDYKDLLAIANENNIKAPKEIIDRVLEAVSQWKKYAKEAGVQKEKINEINRNLKLKIN